MGFFDAFKKGAEMMDEKAKQIASKASDSELKEALRKNPNNRYLREEAKKRGLI